MVFLVAATFAIWAHERNSLWFRLTYPVFGSGAGIIVVLAFSGVHNLNQLVITYPIWWPRPAHLALATAIGVGVATMRILCELTFSNGSLCAPDWVAIMMFFPAALFEELLYRGALFDGLRERLSSWLACLIITAIFCAFHLKWALDPIWLGFAVMINVGLFWVRLRFDNLWPCVIAHWAYNSMITLVVSIPR